MHLDVDPTPLVDPVRRFVLFTNAKCGGTTLKSWFFANLDLPGLERRPIRLLSAFGPRYAVKHVRGGRKITPRGDDLRDVGKVRRMTNWYRRAYCAPALRAGATDGFYTIAAVRHPEDRVVSGYVDKICGEDRHQPWVQAVVAAGGTNGAISFDAFLDYLEAVDDAACNPHWRRQSYVFEGRAIDAWVRLEALEADIRKLGPRVGDAHFGVFARKLQSNPYDPAAVAAAEAAAMPSRPSTEVMAWRAEHGAFPPKEAFLTDATRARIRRIYAKDFAVLPYD